MSVAMAEFDEYDYLEKTVEDTVTTKEVNGDSIKVDGKSSKRRSEEEPEHRSKRSRDEDDRERGRHGSRSRGRERERDVDQGRDGGRDKARERDRDRDRDKDRDKDRERDKDKDRDRGKDRERDRDREKSKDRDRERERREVKEKEREKEKERHRRGPSRDKHSRKEEEELPAEPEVDPERDQRTVFAYQISLKADERDVYEFFSRAGKVRDVRLIMDRNSRRSKGVGYVEFYDVMSVPVAITLSGQLLRGTPVMVKPSEAEKNLVQSTTAAAAVTAATAMGYMGPYSGGARRLYIGNLHFNMTEDALRDVFTPFGEVELVQLPMDPETGNCKGYGFVQYARLEDARAAQQHLNGLELAGRAIKVSAVSENVELQDMSAVEKGELDDDEGGGLALNARSRALLMQKLDRSGTSAGSLSPATVAAPIPSMLGGIPGLSGPVPGLSGPVPAINPLVRPNLIGLPGLLPGIPGLVGPTPVIEPVGLPSEYLLLKNMFDPSIEVEPEFELDIKDDVQDECSKFGTVKHIFVDKNSNGHVYLHFDTVAAASNAQRALHGRFFAGKTITASFMTALAYKTKFPEA